MSKVFIPQMPQRFDTAVNAWVPTVDISPAKSFGEPVIMLPAEAMRLPFKQTLAMIEDKLQSFDDEEDYIVALGDPSFIAAASFILARRGIAVLNLLRWDRRESKYHLIQVGA